MPSLNVQKLEKVYLPSTAKETDEANKAWVTIDTAITAGTLVALDTTAAPVSQSAQILSSAIKEWNLTESSESVKIADITPANIEMLTIEDFGYLSSLISGNVAIQTGGIDTSLKSS